MSFILPLIFCISITGTFAIILNKKFEEVLPLALMSAALLLFISGFWDLRIGYVVVFVIAAFFPIIVFIRKIKGIDFKIFWDQIFTPSFVIFILLYSFVFLLNLNRGFHTWDEVSHWGPMVKETLRLNRFYCVDESVLLVHKDYPPIVTLFEALWCKLCGGYEESYLYKALQTLSFSLLMPFFR